MKSDMSAQAAQEDGEDPEGQTASDQIPFGGYVECGEYEKDKGKNEQDN
jgi:hypothetical protein